MNPRYTFEYAGFQDRCHQPLGHLSGYYSFTTGAEFCGNSQPRLILFHSVTRWAFCRRGVFKTEVLSYPPNAAPVEQVVGVPLKSYISASWTYYFKTK